MNEKTGGISFLGLLTIAFIVLKLCGIIDWSWWWVLAPIWGPFAICGALLLVCGILALIIGIIIVILDD
jgi:hypothetical protein